MRPGFHCREDLPLDHLAARALVALYRQACHGARETQRLPRVQDIYRTEIGLLDKERRAWRPPSGRPGRHLFSAHPRLLSRFWRGILRTVLHVLSVLWLFAFYTRFWSFRPFRASAPVLHCPPPGGGGGGGGGFIRIQ